MMNDPLTTCPRCNAGTVELDPNDRHSGYHSDGRECPFVACDDPSCMALREPDRENLRLAYEHWRYHSYLSGCSHSR